MSIKKRYVALLVAIGVAIGWVTLGGSAAVMHYTLKHRVLSLLPFYGDPF